MISILARRLNPRRGRHAAQRTPAPASPEGVAELQAIAERQHRRLLRPAPEPRHAAPAPEPRLVRPYYVAWERQQAAQPPEDAPQAEVLGRILAGLQQLDGGAEEVAA